MNLNSANLDQFESLDLNYNDFNAIDIDNNTNTNDNNANIHLYNQKQTTNANNQEDFNTFFGSFNTEPKSNHPFTSTMQDSRVINSVKYDDKLNTLDSPLNIEETNIDFNNAQYDDPRLQVNHQQSMASSHFEMPQQNEDPQHYPNKTNPQITVNMPGAYQSNNDGMDLDDSPPFTIESDLYFEPQVNDNNSIITSNQMNAQETDSLFKPQMNHQKRHSQHSHQLQINPLTYQQQQFLKTPTQNQEYHSPFDDSSRVSSFQNIPQQQYLNQQPSNSLFVNGRDIYFDDHESFTKGRLRNGSIDSYYAANVIQNQLHFQQQQQQSQKFNELSPLTTTTSRSSSIHSTQPSFFSAQQYLTRNSFDQQQNTNPSSLNRPSMDIYNRPSIDNQQSQSQQRNPRYTSFTTSITNMIPFMGDNKNSQSIQRRSPPSISLPSQSQPTMQNSANSRHLIRSIFKSNLTSNVDQQSQYENDVINENEVNNVDHDEYLIMSPKEEDFEEIPKKIKKPKRSLFTRFKTPISNKQENDEIPLLDETRESESIDNTNLSGNASSGTPSIMTNGQANANIVSGLPLENTISESSIQEPDYAALFENVGKRKNKNMVSANYRKPKIKKEESSSNFFKQNRNKNVQDGGSDKSSVIDQMSGNNVSIASSNASSSVVDPETDQMSASIANTGKRLLGGKFVSKKRSINKIKKIDDMDEDFDEMEARAVTIAELKTPVATMISKGVEVEVDIASLDLPPDTKIFPTSIINSKNRTRGRKENKEADAIDLSKIYLCNYCSRRFKRHEHLKRHFRSLHTFNKPFDCSICHKKFSRSDNLNQHLKIHKQEEEEGEERREGETQSMTNDNEIY